MSLNFIKFVKLQNSRRELVLLLILVLVVVNIVAALGTVVEVKLQPTEEVKAEEDSGPQILSASVEPTKVRPGDTMVVRAEIKDKSSIKSVKADMGGIETINLELKQGNTYQGIWQNNWLVHSTEIKDYITIITATNIFGQKVQAEDMYIGYPAIDRGSSLAGIRTAIMTGNPANEAGTINKVQVWAYTAMSSVEIGIFYRPNPGSYPDKLTTRSWQAVSDLSIGFNEIEVSLDCQAGDYIGIKWQSGSIDRYTSGGDGFWHTSSDQIPCTNYEFSFGASWIASLYGILDRTAPEVSSVTGPADDTYIATEDLQFTVNYDEAVVVTGSPKIVLTIGEDSCDATYADGSGTTDIVFRYTVAEGDYDDNGIAMDSSITLSGGTLKDAAGNNADIVLAGHEPGLTEVLVDTTAYWLAGYGYRNKITIDNTKVSGSSKIHHFPILFNTTDADLATIANGGRVTNDDGYDIVFASSDGTQLDHEIEKYTKTSGQFIAWVRIPTLVYNNDTVIYMYYGKSGITEDPSKTTTWDSNYKMVQHMEEDPSGSEPQMIDSTANNNDGTSAGTMLTEDQVAGQIDGSLDFDGGDDYIDTNEYTDFQFGTGDFTIGLWLRADAGGWSGNAAPLSNADWHTFGGWDGFHFEHEDDAGGDLNKMIFFVRNVGYHTPTALSEETWYYAVGTRLDGTAYCYLNGVVGDSGADAGNVNVAENVLIGRNFDASYPRNFNGTIDEVRISSIARSTDWIKTSFNNQKYPDKAVYGTDGFYTVTAEPTGSFNSATQKTDGSGSVDISIEVDDGDDDDCKALIEYTSDGTCISGWVKATLDETEGASAVHDDSGGEPSLENDHDYQVGTTANYRIITSDGSNTVTFDWDSKTDAPTADGTSDYCLRLTVNDDTDNQATPATQTVTIDNVDPSISAYNPVDDAPNVAIDSNLVITFSEAVDAEEGYINLYKTTGDVLIQTFNVTTDITGSGTDTITANPTSNLDEGTDYYVKIDATAFDDVVGNSFGGITDKTTWNFTTNTAPVASSVSIDSGATSIALTENGTKNVVCSSTVTDDDGYGDIESVETKLYRSGVGPDASDDKNSHYTLTWPASCTRSNESGTTADFTCTFSVYYFADGTDSDSIYPTENWDCEVTPSDGQGEGTAATDPDGIEMNTLLALDVTSPVNYGNMDLGETTASNQTANITNTGNVRIDVEFDGYGATNGDGKALDCATESVPLANEKYDISDVSYASLSYTLTDTALEKDWDILQRTNEANPVQDQDKKYSYWGLKIPDSGCGGACSGYINFGAVNDKGAD